MIPVISVVGYSDSGKTTVLVRIIEELKKRGYRVATIKHHKGDFDMDHEGTDSFRHMKAGSETTILSSPNKFALISKVEKEKSLDELIDMISNVDIIITEGYKNENKEKIEVFRSANNSQRVKGIKDKLIAVISDDKITDDIERFSFKDINGIVNFIESGYVLRNITVGN